MERKNCYYVCLTTISFFSAIFCTLVHCVERQHHEGGVGGMGCQTSYGNVKKTLSLCGVMGCMGRQTDSPGDRSVIDQICGWDSSVDWFRAVLGANLSPIAGGQSR